MKRITGKYEVLDSLKFFLPNPLPPSNPSLDLSGITELYGTVMLKLGRLNEIAVRLPNARQFIKAYIIKEALLSSAIEGIHTTLLEVFTHPLGEQKPNKETELVLNYCKALDSALQMVQTQGLPLASRVILATHKILMDTAIGSQANPGQYRKQSVKVGNLIPPPAPHIPHLMADLERYINTNDQGIPPLIRAGLVHVQFETIHPFLDGNGRIGRLLIVLMLVESGILSVPILYPSYYFKKHHQEYYQALDSIRLDGDFEGWIKFYLKAIDASSTDAYQRSKEIEQLEKEILKLFETTSTKAHMIDSFSKALSILFQFPIINTKKLAIHLDKSYNTTQKIIQSFIDRGILCEITGQKRNKFYHFNAYLELLDRDYER